jgi:hypothetical protein
MMGKVIMSGVVPQLEAPAGGIALSTIAEGSIVKINENGLPVEFYVAKHNYESGLNGAGRTLLVRKDCYDKRVWHSSNVNAYASSAIDSWLNNTYKALLDASVKNAIGTTKFCYTPGNGSTSVSTLTRSVFLLSLTEFGKTDDFANIEGSALPTANILRIAKLNGAATTQWTRSPYKATTIGACCLDASGGSLGNTGVTITYGSRPAFTIPASALFDEETLTLKGVA